MSRVGLVGRYCLNVFIAKNVLFSPSVVVEGFAWHNSLDLASVVS